MARRKTTEKKLSVELAGVLLEKLEKEAARLGIDVSVLVTMRLAESFNPPPSPIIGYPPLPRPVPRSQAQKTG